MTKDQYDALELKDRLLLQILERIERSLERIANQANE